MKKINVKAFEPIDNEEKDLIEEGIPYQTFISSIIHKYLNGSLAPKS
jgi:predicted DNA binding CopG/RHH family protein